MGSLSGRKINTKAETKPAPAIKNGKFFGPTGSAKKGDSRLVALTKNISATATSAKPNIRSDTISSHPILWKGLELLP